jgi:hypothetical protein
MLPAFLSVGLAGVLALLLAAAAASVSSPWWKGRVHLGIAFGILGVAASSFVVFLVTWLLPPAGAWVATVLVASAIVEVLRSRVWRYWRPALPIVLLTVGFVVVDLGVMYFWGSPSGAFSLAEQRFGFGGLANDNYIPYLFSERLVTGESTHQLLPDWNGSDRPPLQAGLLLIVRAIAAPIAGGTSGAFGGSIVAQALWIPAMFAALRAAGTARKAAIVGVVMVGVSGTTILNSLFTWPKLMSAALILCSCVFLLDAFRRPLSFRRHFVFAVVAFTFAMLAHGGAAFAIPLVVFLGIVAWRRQAARTVLSSTAIAVGAGLIAYLPWVLYQRFADPPGDRLLKWHLAGVVPSDDPRGFGQALLDSLQSRGLEGWLADRVANLGAVFNPNLLAGVNCFCVDTIRARRSAEFTTTTIALDLAFPALLAIAVLLLIRVACQRRLRLEDRQFLLIGAVSVACILGWCLLMFIPGSTIVHQGSQVWLMLLIAAPAVWLATRHLRLALALVGGQLVATLMVYLPTDASPTPDPLAVAVTVLGLAVVAGTVVRELAQGQQNPRLR